MEGRAGVDAENPHDICHLCLQDHPVSETFLLSCTDRCSVCLCLACTPIAIRFGKCMFCHAPIDPLFESKPAEHPAVAACTWVGVLSLVIHLYTLYVLGDRLKIDPFGR